jgi:uncharacterized membrane protein
MTRSRVSIVLVIVAVALALAAVWLAFIHNPDVDNASPSDDDFTCAAPFDTALNDDAANFPGDPPPNEEVAARCWEVGNDRFELAIYSGVAAMGIGTLAALVSVLRTWPDKLTSERCDVEPLGAGKRWWEW